MGVTYVDFVIMLEELVEVQQSLMTVIKCANQVGGLQIEYET